MVRSIASRRAATAHGESDRLAPSVTRMHESVHAAVAVSSAVGVTSKTSGDAAHHLLVDTEHLGAGRRSVLVNSARLDPLLQNAAGFRLGGLERSGHRVTR